MASALITTRKTKSGPRYVVRYRCGGFAYPLVHAGSFKTMKEARLRRDLVAGELAAGRDPAAALRALVEPPARRTLRRCFDEFIEARIDVGASATRLYGNAKNKLGRLADRDPATLKASDVQAWIADCQDLSPKTIRHYLSTLRQVLDHFEIEPNPARNPRVKVPALEGEEVNPPARGDFDAIIAKLAPKVILPARLMEACALRVGETIQLTYGDVDFANGRVRVSKARTKGRTAGQRWLPVPGELLDEIDALVPLEDTHEDRRVFPLTAPTVRDAIARACKFAGVAHYHPHDLRHRRCSLWVNVHNFDPVTVKTWSGHANVSMLLDTYSHVMIDPADEWADFWRFAYRERRGDVVPVWSRAHDAD
jgi:integrase